MRSFAQFLAEGACHFNALAHDNNVNIRRWTLQEYVANIAADNVTLHSQFIGSLRNFVEQGLVQYLFQFFAGRYIHNLFFAVYLIKIVPAGD